MDISVLSVSDAGTGIQRVTRALLASLQALSLPDLAICPVGATAAEPYRNLAQSAASGQWQPLERAEPRRGDVFLGLDLSSAILPHHERQIEDWRSRGVAIHITIYDLLPLLKPRFFRRRARRHFARWIGLIERQADGIVCISRTVAEDFTRWHARWWPLGRRRVIRTATFDLGGDIAGSVPSRGLPANSGAVFAWLARRPTILMVGTVEPRKAYDKALAAFKWAWKADPSRAPQLLIVGRPGWKTRRLQGAMRRISGLTGPFLWLPNASDEFLDALYPRATGLLLASHAEGFGLPLVEALAHGCPALVRDLPVFREVERPGVSFFQSDAPRELGRAFCAWLDGLPAARPASVMGRLPTWTDAAKSLLDALGLGAAADSAESSSQAASL